MLEVYDGAAPRRVGKRDGLTREWVSAIAALPDGLWAGVWGGLARFDGQGWTMHVTIPPLRDQVVTALSAHGGELAVGTQWHGVVLGRTGAGWRQVDEGRGLRHAWVRCLADTAGGLLAGTFDGGVYVVQGDQARPLPGLPNAAVTAIDPSGVWLANRGGLDRWDGEQVVRQPWVPGAWEPQAVMTIGEQVWVATRVGLVVGP
jgi:ligand-binding sensor domain-containing protein